MRFLLGFASAIYLDVLVVAYGSVISITGPTSCFGGGRRYDDYEEVFQYVIIVLETQKSI